MIAKQELHSASRVVLVVDDDLHVLKVTSRMLVGAGYQPVEATTPAEALVIATQIKLDVFLLDAILPGISGPDLADELAKAQGEAKIVFMSGLDPLSVWVAFGRPCQVLRKPFTSEELIRKIETPAAAALDGANLVREWPPTTESKIWK